MNGRPIWWRRAVLIATVAVLLVALARVGTGERAVPVRTAVARMAPLDVTVVTNGTVEPIDGMEIRSGLAGVVKEIAQAGARVAPGEVVLRIDDTSVREGLARARAERIACEAEVETAKAAALAAGERAGADRRLVSAGALAKHVAVESGAVWAETESRWRAVDRRLPQLLAGIDARIQFLERQSAAAVVTSPHAGTVHRVTAKAGENVLPGVLLVAIANLGRLQVRASFDQADLGRVHEAQSVRVSSDAYPERSWKGVVDRVLPEVVVRESRAVSDGLVRVEGPFGMVPGMTVDLEVTVEHADQALQIPNEAVRRDARGTTVLEVEDGRVRRVPIHIGRASVSDSEIVGGLAVGAVVVVGFPDGLLDGSAVAAVGADG